MRSIVLLQFAVLFDYNDRIVVCGYRGSAKVGERGAKVVHAHS